MSTTSRFIGYIRVSTKGQGESGLGLEGQQSTINDYVSKIKGELISSYVEVETGKRFSINNRPQLIKALAHAKRSKATLVIAKLDRLSRNVAFLSGLMESRVEFVACDNPAVNPLVTHVLAAVAENEAKMISARTKAALAAYKSRGGLLGSARPECRGNLKQEAREKGARSAGAAHRRLADEAYTDLVPQIAEWRSGGLSLRAIAERLNGEGHTTRHGKPWNKVQVLRVLRRFA